MLKIYFDCQASYSNTIKRKLNLYFEDIQYVSSYHDHENIIIIKDIYDEDDIRQMTNKNNQQLIFLIDSGEYMFELLEYEPLAFIRVQHIDKDLANVITILQFENRNVGVMLDFKSGFQKIRINAENIKYIESYGHYLFIHTLSASFKVREKISDILKILEPLGFMRVHKSYIINKNYIKQQSASTITLRSKTEIPIGNRFKKNNMSSDNRD